MATDEELDKTAQETQRTLKMFEEILKREEQFQREKEDFARQFGVGFDEMAEKTSQNLEKTRAGLTPAEQQEIAREQEQFEIELSRDLSEAEEKFRQMRSEGEADAPKRPRRMRNMI